MAEHIASPGTAPFTLTAAMSIITTAAEASASSPDYELLIAWQDRQSGLATIETRGSFFYADTHSPVEQKLFDRAEVRIHDLPARTIDGVLAKSWMAMSHIGTVCNDEDRILHDAINRADIDDVRSLLDGADFELKAAFNVIEALLSIAAAHTYGGRA